MAGLFGLSPAAFAQAQQPPAQQGQRHKAELSTACRKNIVKMKERRSPIDGDHPDAAALETKAAALGSGIRMASRQNM